MNIISQFNKLLEKNFNKFLKTLIFIWNYVILKNGNKSDYCL